MGNLLECLIMSKCTIYSVYSHIRQRKAANLHVWEAGTTESLEFLVEKLHKGLIVQLKSTKIVLIDNELILINNIHNIDSV